MNSRVKHIIDTMDHSDPFAPNLNEWPLVIVTYPKVSRQVLIEHLKNGTDLTPFDKVGEYYGLVLDSRNDEQATAMERRAGADSLAQIQKRLDRGECNLTCIAIVNNAGPFLKTVLNIVLMLQNISIPVKMFSHLLEAKSWALNEIYRK